MAAGAGAGGHLAVVHFRCGRSRPLVIRDGVVVAGVALVAGHRVQGTFLRLRQSGTVAARTDR